MRMETLKPVDENTLLTHYIAQLATLAWIGSQQKTRSLGHRLSRIIINLLKDRGIPEWDPSTNLKTIQNELGKVTPAWIGLCQDLVNYAKAHGVINFDLHSGNFMRRGGVLVITDPFV